MGELGSPKEGCRAAKHTSRREQSFEGNDLKCSAGAMDGLDVMVSHDSDWQESWACNELVKGVDVEAVWSELAKWFVLWCSADD